MDQVGMPLRRKSYEADSRRSAEYWGVNGWNLIDQLPRMAEPIQDSRNQSQHFFLQKYEIPNWSVN